MFAPETLRTLSSTTRFHAPLYPPLNTLTPLKILFFSFFFPYKMNAPHPLPFLQYFNSELYHLPFSVGNFYKSIMLPIRHFLPLFFAFSLSFRHLSRFLSHPFFLIFSFSLLRFFLSFHRHVKGTTLPSPYSLLSFSNLSTPSKKFRGVCTFPVFFSSLVFLFS